VLVLETPSGGGMGRVADRDPGRVRSDLEAELISQQAARDVYGIEDA
jgi:N-methylhydantoinase B/oxoprolinase/acetone carboxylase alpha subunit